jgi:hypothetical protein
VLQLSKMGGNETRGDSDSDFLVREPEQLFNEPDLKPNILAAYPPYLTLPHHVHRLIALNGSPGRVKFPEALLGVDAAFDRAMVLFNDVVQILHRAMPTSATKCPFLLNSRKWQACRWAPGRY